MTSAIQTSKTDPVPHYAQVAVPVHLSKTFTYRLPASMRTAARVGSRVIVPLGRKPLTGYIVGLLPNLRPGTSLVESEIKDVHELLDAEHVSFTAAVPTVWMMLLQYLEEHSAKLPYLKRVVIGGAARHEAKDLLLVLYDQDAHCLDLKVLRLD